MTGKKRARMAILAVLILSLVALLIAIADSSEPQACDENSADYDKYVSVMTGEVRWLVDENKQTDAFYVHDGDPFSEFTEDFKKIYFAPSSHICFAKKMMTDNGVDIETKIVSALAMQRLPATKLIAIIEYALSLAEQGKLDMSQSSRIHWNSNQLEVLAFSELKYNTYFALHCKDKAVVDIINKLLKSNLLQPVYNRIMVDILAGKESESLRGNMEIGAKYDCPVSLYERFKLDCFWNYFYRGERE